MTTRQDSAWQLVPVDEYDPDEQGDTDLQPSLGTLEIPGCAKSVPLGSKWDAVVERTAMLNEPYNIRRLRRVK